MQECVFRARLSFPYTPRRWEPGSFAEKGRRPCGLGGRASLPSCPAHTPGAPAAQVRPRPAGQPHPRGAWPAAPLRPLLCVPLSQRDTARAERPGTEVSEGLRLWGRRAPRETQVSREARTGEREGQGEAGTGTGRGEDMVAGRAGAGAGRRCRVQVRGGTERRCGAQVRDAGAGQGGAQVRGAGEGRRCAAERSAGAGRSCRAGWSAGAGRRCTGVGRRCGAQLQGRVECRCGAQVRGREECEWGPLAARTATLSGGMGGISTPDALPVLFCPISCARCLFSLLGLSWTRELL